MESSGNFNIRGPKNKTPEQLPENMRPDFVSVSGKDGQRGFIRRTAAEFNNRAQQQVKIVKKSVGDPAFVVRNAETLIHQEALKYEVAREEFLELLRKMGSRGERVKSFKVFLITQVPVDLMTSWKDFYEFFRADVSFFREAVTFKPNILSQASPEILDNKDVALAGVAVDAEGVLKFLSPRLMKDRDVIMAALSQNPYLDRKYVSEEMLDQIIYGEEPPHINS